MQATQLYLDTARLGRMSLQAQQAHMDFTRLAGEEGGSLFYERFLREGADDWSPSIRCAFPGLTCWRGLAALKEDLRTLTGADADLPVLMVNRSSQLMSFAARLLFQRCRNVLVTDLGWPPYRQILEREALRSGRKVTSVALTPLISDPQMTADAVIRFIREAYQQSGCDGLFLTAVSHLGVQLPVEGIVRSIEATREVRFAAVDGAQDFCHTFGDLRTGACDLYLAGSHKWLRGFHPMGLGFYGRRSSKGLIETLLNHLIATRELDDPLLRFTTQLETAALDGESETVNLIPLFTCQGAVSDALQEDSLTLGGLRARKQNAIQAAEWAQASGWHPLLPAAPFQTGILLLQAERKQLSELTPQELRHRFALEGVALTAYEAGVVRLSMLDSAWKVPDKDVLHSALSSVA